jgi:hypothetical protein
MARFFFDTSIGEIHMRDVEGLEYADVARARQDARQSLAALVAEALGADADHCAVTVRDSSGKFIVRFFADLGEDTGPA